MKKIIINADDLGMSGTVNREIESCIQKGLITSTTIMANMPDFDGARKLYDTYNEAISFGWHMNLTEGEPLTKSQALLDFGYFVETKDGVRMNGMAFWKQKFFPKTIREEIKKELRAQIGKIRDNRIRLSHADSHQHIHTSPALLLVLPSLLSELKIERCRRMRNMVASPLGRCLRDFAMTRYKWQRIRMADAFGPLRDFLSNPALCKDDEVVELMVHPGASETDNPKAANEYTMLKDLDLNTINAKLVTYWEI